MDICVREYQNSDYAGLKSLLSKVYNSAIDQQTLQDYYITNNRTILIASLEDNTCVGCAFLEVQQDYIRPNKVLYVTYVAVDEKYRKKGIGRQLFIFIETFCEKKGCLAIELTSADFRTGAHEFYKALGYSRKKTTVFIKEVENGINEGNTYL